MLSKDSYYRIMTILSRLSDEELDNISDLVEIEYDIRNKDYIDDLYSDYDFDMYE